MGGAARGNLAGRAEPCAVPARATRVRAHGRVGRACRPDITKIKTTLGWEPKVALRDGLAFMVEDFKKRLNV